MTPGGCVPILGPVELFTAFYVGAGCTAALALCVITWLRAKHENALSDAFDEGLEQGLTHQVKVITGAQGVAEGRVPPSFIDETRN